MNKPRDMTAVASYAHTTEGAKLFAPSAARNVEAISDVLSAHAPESGNALEIASGTGQHIAAFAARLPKLNWQPTELDASRRASIDVYTAEMGNVAAAEELDATSQGWHVSYKGQALITLANLLHLISEQEARTVVAEAGQALALGGILHLYGPFLRDGETTSAGDAAFNAKLRAHDSEVGYKDDWDVIEWIHAAGLELVQVLEMPANNMSFVAKRVF